MELTSLLALSAAAQGFMLAIILSAIKASNRSANLLLAAVIGVFSLRLLINFWGMEGYFSAARPYLSIIHNISFATGPLVYLYTKALTSPSLTLKLNMLMHALPMLIFAVLSYPGGPFYSYEVLSIDHPLSNSPDLVRTSALHGLSSNLILLAYCLAAFRLVPPYQRRLRNRYSSVESIDLQWLKGILLVYGLFGGLLVGTFNLMRLITGNDGDPTSAAHLPASIVIFYFIAIAGFRQSQVFLLSPLVEEEPTEQPSPEPLATESDSQSKYQRSGLSDERLHALWLTIKQAMEEDQLYLNSELQLRDLAAQLLVSPQELSQALNVCAGQKFYDYINTLRVKAAQSMLTNPQHRKRPLIDIAADAGFNSKSTFNKYFKQVVGLTPSAFRRENLTQMQQSPP